MRKQTSFGAEVEISYSYPIKKMIIYTASQQLHCSSILPNIFYA